MQTDWNARARAILNREWDPIHLSRMPDADEWNWADEYDLLLQDLLAVLLKYRGVSDDGLLALLEWAEVEFIGLRSDGRPGTKRQGRRRAPGLGTASGRLLP